MSKKECPSCAMEIDSKEKVCPICGYEFPLMRRIYIMVAVILIGVIAWYMIF
jgi:rRNA maturation endonuclease Nob1